MSTQPETGNNGAATPHGTQPAESRVLHSLEDLPASVGQVSRGPFGAISRRDHTSWKSRKVTDPGYWCGRFDSELGERVRVTPIPHVAICFGIGLLAGLIVNFAGSHARD